MRQYKVQYQESGSGLWCTVSVMNDLTPSSVILQQMRSVQNMKPGKRVRCVDDSDRLVDMI